jgi:hypothetical protein
LITIYLDGTGFDELQALPPKVERWEQEAIEEAAGDAYSDMSTLAPVRSGAYRASIQEVIGTKEAWVGPTVPYAIFVEVDTRPHIIKPVNAKLLRFEIAGHVIFTPVVHHPGTTGQHVVGRTADMLWRKLPDILKRVWDRVVGT